MNILNSGKKFVFLCSPGGKNSIDLLLFLLDELFKKHGFYKQKIENKQKLTKHMRKV